MTIDALENCRETPSEFGKYQTKQMHPDKKVQNELNRINAERRENEEPELANLDEETFQRLIDEKNSFDIANLRDALKAIQSTNRLSAYAVQRMNGSTITKAIERLPAVIHEGEERHCSGRHF